MSIKALETFFSEHQKNGVRHLQELNRQLDQWDQEGQQGRRA